MTKYAVILVCLVFSVACTQSVVESAVESADNDLITKKALLLNQLAVDGCSWHFAVAMGDEWGQYLASDKTSHLVYPLIEKAMSQTGTYSIGVEITFRLTGAKKEVECGWGKRLSMDEIEVVQVREI